ncbi:MAG TPA: oxidoreductase [Diaminobutyricibacter sp.]|jgi:aryl-alcohol dehydrogenase-like predicted oxidoreductase
MTDAKADLEAAGSFALGRWQVNRIGYGAMQLAGDNVFGPPRDRDEALRVLRAAVDGGINHIDTAQYYGPGVVNELIREALYPYPTDLAIVSKVAARRDDVGAVLAYDEPDQLRAGIEENLVALGLERLAAVNLRVMHGSRPGKRFDAQLAALIEARDDGLIDGIGLSNISTEHLHRAVDQTEIACVQNLFNLGDQRSSDLLDECTLRGIAFVPFFPLGWTSGVQNGVQTSSVLADLCRRLGATPAQLALAWLLDLSPNVLLIPGTRTRQHLTENIRSGRIRIDETARAELERQFPRVEAG